MEEYRDFGGFAKEIATTVCCTVLIASQIGMVTDIDAIEYFPTALADIGPEMLSDVFCHHNSPIVTQHVQTPILYRDQQGHKQQL